MICAAVIAVLVMVVVLAWPLPKHNHEPVIRFLLHHKRKNDDG